MKLPHANAHHSLMSSGTIYQNPLCFDGIKMQVSPAAEKLRSTAGENLVVLQTYSPDTFKNLEKRCRDIDEKKTKNCMINFLIVNGLANERAAGHGSSRSGKSKGTQKKTDTFLKAVALALNPKK